MRNYGDPYQTHTKSLGHDIQLNTHYTLDKVSIFNNERMNHKYSAASSTVLLEIHNFLLKEHKNDCIAQQEHLVSKNAFLNHKVFLLS